jgi:hypothetical protein
MKRFEKEQTWDSQLIVGQGRNELWASSDSRVLTSVSGSHSKWKYVDRVLVEMHYGWSMSKWEVEMMEEVGGSQQIIHISHVD